MISFLRYLMRGSKWGLLLIILIGVLHTGLGLLFVFFSKEVIDIVTAEQEGSWLVYALGMAATMVANALLRLATLSLTNKTSVHIGNAIRSKIFSHLLYTRWQSLGKLHSGDVLTRIIKDTDNTVQLLTNLLPNSIIALLQLLGALTLMYIFSPTLALILGIGMPFVLAVGRIFFRRMHAFSTEIKETESRINIHMQESLGNQAVIRTFERQEAEINHLDFIQGQLYQTMRKRIGLTMYGNLMSNAAFSGGYLIAFLWGAWELKKGLIPFGVMTTFLQLVTRIQRPLLDLMSAVPGIVAARSSIDRLVHVLEYQTEDIGKRTLLLGDISIIAKGVHFAYEGTPEREVFSGLDLTITSGQMVAIMGPTGTGKTTLIRLLLGLVRPNQGTLQLKSNTRIVPISEATRGNFIYVPQGNSLFSGTIRDNLLVGDPTADDKLLKQVLMIAEAGFVFDMPQGLDTMLSERGGGVSEGQAQRLAIARSLLRPGRILLFDEATSALDMQTEQRLMANLRKHLDGRIALFITHHDEVAKTSDLTLRLR